MMSFEKSAIIVGIKGQDGSYLEKKLQKTQINVIGISRDSIFESNRRLGSFSILSEQQVNELIRYYRPLEIYYLAAHHNSAEFIGEMETLSLFRLSQEVHEIGLLNFLDAIRSESPNTRLFNASSSLIFDGTSGPTQNETTPHSPVGFYGITKLGGQLLCEYYRNHFGIFASSGILYNHESALRRENFLSKKLILAAHRISQNLQKTVEVGNLNAIVDWGYAPDFIDAFTRLLKVEGPGDFIISTNEAKSVKEFATIIFAEFGLNLNNFIVQNKEMSIRNTATRIGDYSKLHKLTGWTPSLTFEEMAKKLVRDYLELIENND